MQELNIVELIENNPISKLSKEYNNKLYVSTNKLNYMLDIPFDLQKLNLSSQLNKGGYLVIRSFIKK
jgi:hypothetical protein